MASRLEWLPGWVWQEVGPILTSELDDAAVERALRSVLRLAEDVLIKHGTTSALLAKELVQQRSRK